MGDSCIMASTASSHASSSLVPWAEKNLMPLSYGLCEALITTPNLQPDFRAMYAMPGVGSGPIRLTLTPAAMKPASSAASNM